MTDDQWRAGVHQRLTDIEKRIEKIEREDAVSAYRWEVVEKDLEAIKNSVTWITRLVLGTLIVGIVTFAVNGGLVLP